MQNQLKYNALLQYSMMPTWFVLCNERKKEGVDGRGRKKELKRQKNEQANRS
jgi:hypothetical protein